MSGAARGTRVGLVTGASRGIGAAAAAAIAAPDLHLILVARTVGGLEATDDRVRAAGGTATLVPADLTAGDAIEKLALAMSERFGRLDLLVGAAGMLGALTPVGHMEPKTWDQLFALNLTANQRLIRAFETPLRRAPAGRALFVTAPQARKPEAYWGPYAATKAALECLVKCWAAETARTQLRVNLLDPGAIETGLRAQAFPGEPKGAVPGPDQLAPVFRELLGPECRRHGQLVGAF